jgi:hypothetical protein
VLSKCLMPGQSQRSDSTVGWLLTMLRFRQVPTFGRDTIRRFGGSVSALKRLAARDFEDILQEGSHLWCHHNGELTASTVLDAGH